jgi:hypothetical protein
MAQYITLRTRKYIAQERTVKEEEDNRRKVEKEERGQW